MRTHRGYISTGCLKLSSTIDVEAKNLRHINFEAIHSSSIISKIEDFFVSLILRAQIDSEIERDYTYSQGNFISIDFYDLIAKVMIIKIIKMKNL